MAYAVYECFLSFFFCSFLGLFGHESALLYVEQGLEAVLDKAVHLEDGKKITRYGRNAIP